MKKKNTFSLYALALALALAVPAFGAIEDTGYSDVSANAWYAEAAVYCRDNGMMQGTSDTAFSPDMPLTREMLSTIFYRMAGSPTVTGEDAFTDTVDGAWYDDAVKWASEEGIISGYGNNIFGVGDAVTREQMAAILWRYAGSPTVEAEEIFADETDISSWANVAVDWARNNDFISDINITDNTFAPKENATRAEVAYLFMGYLAGQEILTQESQTDQETEVPQEPEQGRNVLIAYFSCTGNTEAVANQLNAVLEADLYKIIPETPYTDADLDYGDDNSRTSIEMNDPNARPVISGNVENMEEYDVIFLGYPIWWGDAPRIMNTFVESYDFNGKTVIPFCTSGSSGIGSSASHLEDLTEGAIWLDGQRFNSSATESIIRDWVEEMALDLDMAA